MRNRDNEHTGDVFDCKGFNPEILNHPSLSTQERNSLLHELDSAKKPSSENGCLFLLIPLLVGIAWIGIKWLNWTGEYYVIGRLGLAVLAATMAFLVKMWAEIRTGEQAGYTMQSDW